MDIDERIRDFAQARQDAEKDDDGNSHGGSHVTSEKEGKNRRRLKKYGEVKIRGNKKAGES